MIILVISAYILLILLFLLVLLLALPFDYRAAGYKYDNYRVGADVKWLLGALRYECSLSDNMTLHSFLKVFGFSIPLKGRHKKKKRKCIRKRHRIQKKPQQKKDGSKYLNRQFLSRVFGALKDLINCIRPKVFLAEGIFGFDDPCTTGYACGLLGVLAPLLKGSRIRLDPVFDREVLEGRFLIQGRIWLAVVLWITLRLLFSRPVRNILKEDKNRKEETAYAT